MRTTWDALASAGAEVYVGDPARGAEELAGLFGRLAAEPRGGVCVEVGCGPGRMTPALAVRFERVIALDVSPAMLAQARAAVAAAGIDNVTFLAVSGERLDGVESGVADALVCYLVLQHLPGRKLVLAYLAEFARVLKPGGEAFVQLPVLVPGLQARLWRALRSLALPVLDQLACGPARRAAYRGFRLTGRELEDGLRRASLRVRARVEESGSAYRYSRELFLRLERG